MSADERIRRAERAGDTERAKIERARARGPKPEPEPRYTWESAEDWWESLGYAAPDMSTIHPAVDIEDLDAEEDDVAALARAWSRRDEERWTVADIERLARRQRNYRDYPEGTVDDYLDVVAYGRQALGHARVLEELLAEAAALAEAHEWDLAFEALDDASAHENEYGDDPATQDLRGQIEAAFEEYLEGRP